MDNKKMNTFIEVAMKQRIEEIMLNLSLFPNVEKCNPDSYFTEDDIDYLSQYTIQQLGISVDKVYNSLCNLGDILDLANVSDETFNDMCNITISKLYIIQSIKNNIGLFDDDFDVVCSQFEKSYSLYFIT